MAAHSRILTLVFTDLADSTALKLKHGDQAAAELMERHDARRNTALRKAGLD
jgi:class 3 adenylate cyclase